MCSISQNIKIDWYLFLVKGWRYPWRYIITCKKRHETMLEDNINLVKRFQPREVLSWIIKLWYYSKKKPLNWNSANVYLFKDRYRKKPECFSIPLQIILQCYLKINTHLKTDHCRTQKKLICVWNTSSLVNLLQFCFWNCMHNNWGNANRILPSIKLLVVNHIVHCDVVLLSEVMVIAVWYCALTYSETQY